MSDARKATARFIAELAEPKPVGAAQVVALAAIATAILDLADAVREHAATTKGPAT